MPSKEDYCMPEGFQAARVVVTSRTLFGARRTISALKRAVPAARIRSAGLRGILILEAEGDPLELAARVTGECSEDIGRAVAVLAEVTSLFEPIRDSAVKIGAEQIGEDEPFCFRLNKRGAHGLDRDTPVIEYEIGGAIWVALREKYGKRPLVNLKDPEVTVMAEVLGADTAVGILRKMWRKALAIQGDD
jgi:tRNA(Ser,Leu) C12 N-acetylase TAN1